MSIAKALATGNSKIYYNVENEFDAVGTLYRNANMYYTAAHPTMGLWLCGITGDNQPIPIGFISWSNIDRIIVDDKNERVFIVPNNYDAVINNADFTFRKMYKGAFTHTMDSEMKIGQDKAFILPKDLFSGNMLPYLQQKCTFEQKVVEGVSSFWSYVYVALFILVLVGSILSLF